MAWTEKARQRYCRAGLRYASNLTDAEAICAKHYAHLCPGYVAESIRAAFTPLGIVPESNVVALKA